MIQQYSAFKTAAELHSISKTAEQLGYTQSGLSRQIQALEQNWGISLFKRSKFGVVLSPEGETLLPYITKVLEADTLLLDQVAGLKGNCCGMIRIGSISSITLRWLPQILTRYATLRPNMEVSILNDAYGRRC